jgi:HAD superfamily hydrolase (TIGR01509 family)
VGSRLFLFESGDGGKGIVDLYNAMYAAALDPTETVRLKHEYFRSHPTEFKPIQPVVDVVLSHKGTLPMAIASGSTRENVHLELETIGIRHLFKVILMASDAIAPKPSPAIFLEAARRMGVPPRLCQVFEDGDPGLEAAKIAGMVATDVRVNQLMIYVRNQNSRLYPLFS